MTHNVQPTAGFLSGTGVITRKDGTVIPFEFSGPTTQTPEALAEQFNHPVEVHKEVIHGSNSDLSGA